MTDYRTYHLSLKEKIKYGWIGLGISSGIAILFYKSLLAAFICSPFVLWFWKYQEKELVKRRKWEFQQQFLQGIRALSAALNAGYSIENAFAEARKDLRLMYREDAFVVQEFSWIEQQLSLNRNVEEVLDEMAQRTAIEDVENFAEIFQTAKRTGGNLMKVIHQTEKNIGDRLEVQREMETLLSQKKLEANIMSIVPLGIIVYMWVSSPGFLDVLYHNVFGVVFMSGVLGAYIAAYLLMKRIVNITW